MTVLPRSTLATAYAPWTLSTGSPSFEIRRTASTPVGAATVTRSPVAFRRNVVIEAAVGIRPVSPLMPRRAVTTAMSAGSDRLRSGARRTFARTDGPRRMDGARVATWAAPVGRRIGFGELCFGQYGTDRK